MGSNTVSGTFAQFNTAVTDATLVDLSSSQTLTNKSIAASQLTGAMPALDGSASTGIAAGATGGGSDQVFYENGQTVTTNYTITNGKNAMSAGPITINSGVTVTNVGSGETYTVVLNEYVKSRYNRSVRWV